MITKEDQDKELESFLLKKFILKPLNDLSGYYVAKNGLIHFFNKNKKYETTKILIRKS